jgi:cytoskeletal protein RodZ
MVFHKRSLAGPETLGQRLRHLREEARLTPAVIAVDIGVAQKYILAIEESRYHDLPGQVYARNFVRLYVRRLELNEAAAMERFDEEYALAQAVRPSRRPLISQPPKTDLPWWRRHLRPLIAVSIILCALGFFGWQIIRLYIPPALLIVQPSTNMTSREAAITVSGQTEPGAQVAINSQIIEVQENGQFVERIDLNTGLNTLKITAKKPRSGERVVVRQVLVEP